MSNPLPIADLLAAMPSEKVTAQMIVEAVARHLWVQNKKSINGDVCLYRHPEGLRCAVGVLIPDSCYDKPKFEGHSLRPLLASLAKGSIAVPSSLPDYFNRYERLLSRLQFMHDLAFVPDMSRVEFREMLRYFIADYIIDYSFLYYLPPRSPTENAHNAE